MFWSVVALIVSSSVLAVGGATVHTVIPTECKNYFSWQSLGMFYSHRKTGQPGKMTRILCCTKEEYDRLPDVDKHLVPTHWAPSYTVHPRTGDVYHAYNKPLAVLDWMAKTQVEEDYVLVIDADMIMREAFVPEELGAKPGWAVAAFFGYMKGTDNQLALTHVPEIVPRNDTLAGRKGRRGDMAGGFTLMHRDDMKRVAPLWLKYTERVREDPGAWNLTGDDFAKKPGDKPWISEMYGYSFGCAKADVWHITHGEHMLYPDPPKVLHYGLLWKVKGTSYEFDKHWHFDFDPFPCPPWDLSSDPRKTKKGLFAHPPSPAEFTTTGFELLRDLLSVEPIITLNAAFCERHLRNCPKTEELVRECGRAHELEEQLDAAYRSLQLPDPCVNQQEQCEWWASVGECEKTAGYMYSNCRLACKWCVPRDQAAKALPEGTQQEEGQQRDGGEAAGGTGDDVVSNAQQQQQQEQAVAAQQQQTEDAHAQATEGGADGAADKGSQGGDTTAQQGGEGGDQQEQAEQKAGDTEGEQGQGEAQGEQAATEGARAGAGADGIAGEQGEELDTAATQEAAPALKETYQQPVQLELATTGERGEGEGEGQPSKHARAEQMLLETDSGVGGDPGAGALVSSELFGLQAMVGHHMQMLSAFWGAVLVGVLYKIRRRLFPKRASVPYAARHRVASKV